MRLRTFIKEVVIGALLLLIFSNIINYFRKPKLDFTHIPNIQMTLVDGSVFHKIQNKPIVIHFWATWCKVCKLEAENIERLSHKYTVLTIAVNSGSNENIQNYLKERKLTFKVYNDLDGSWAKKFKVKAFPTTFIYNTKGVLKFTEVGYTTTAGLLARLAFVK